MEKINDLFDQEITRVIDSFPSIYTKDDVVNLLSTLRPQILAEASEVKPIVGITEEQFQEFNSNLRSKLVNSLNDGTLDPIDYNSGEFTVDYKNVIRLENVDFDTDCITDELHDIMLDEFQNIFGKFLTKSE